MVAISQRRIFPEDVAFQEATGKLYGAGESVRGKPLDFGRRGGASLGQAGDLYSTLLGAATRAVGTRDLARGARELNWDRAARMKAAETQRARTQGVADVVSGTYGGISDFLAKKALAEDEPEVPTPTATPTTMPYLEGRQQQQGLEETPLLAPSEVTTTAPPPEVGAAPVVVSPMSPTDPYEYSPIPGQQFPWSFRKKGSGSGWTPFNYSEDTVRKLEAAAGVAPVTQAAPATPATPAFQASDEPVPSDLSVEGLVNPRAKPLRLSDLQQQQPIPRTGVVLQGDPRRLPVGNQFMMDIAEGLYPLGESREPIRRPEGAEAGAEYLERLRGMGLSDEDVQRQFERYVRLRSPLGPRPSTLGPRRGR